MISSPSMPMVASWRWDLEAIRAKGYTDNVVDLMVGKLNRLAARHTGGIEGDWPASVTRPEPPRWR